MSRYSDKLNDPRWQRKRLETLESHNWACDKCCDIEESLHVHHRLYWSECDPWDYPDQIYAVLCKNCHDLEHRNLKNNLDQLVECLKSKFYADDFEVLAKGFCRLRSSYTPEIVVQAVSSLLSSPERLDIVVRDYVVGAAGGNK